LAVSFKLEFVFVRMKNELIAILPLRRARRSGMANKSGFSFLIFCVSASELTSCEF